MRVTYHIQDYTTSKLAFPHLLEDLGKLVHGLYAVGGADTSASGNVQSLSSIFAVSNVAALYGNATNDSPTIRKDNK